MDRDQLSIGRECSYAYLGEPIFLLGEWNVPHGRPPKNPSPLYAIVYLAIGMNASSVVSKIGTYTFA